MKIAAAVARAKSAPLSIETLQLDNPRPDEILVRIVATGICHTDIAMRDQTYPVPQPIVLGHEGAGIVQSVGASVTKVAPDDHVVISFDSCGRCDSCKDHQPQYCYHNFEYNFSGRRPDGTSPLSKNGEVIHGNFFGQSSFATFSLCHERNVVKVRHDAPLEMLGPLACGIQTGAGAIINSFKMGPGHSLAVFGTGTVGLSAVMAARLVGATTIIAIDLFEERLAMALELGATHAINAKNEKAADAIKRITRDGVNFAFETTGLPAVIRSGIDSLAPRGICGMVGAAPDGTEVALDTQSMMGRGQSLRGIIEGDATPEVFIPQLIELYLQGRFPFDRLIKFYSFDQINMAIEDSEAGRAIKPVIRMPA
jgi:aryl-alcohol dehydrogenase